MIEPPELVRVSADAPGYRRIRCGRGFRYVDPDGANVRDPAILARIRALAIPPAWERVWICMVPHGHLQATGYDSKGRKQYRYHEEWQVHRAADKFAHLARFARALPRLRQRVARDLAAHGLPRSKVLAALVRLLEATLVRVGNEEYARANRSFGLTTLRKRHVQLGSSVVQLRFRGKSGVEHRIQFRDRTLAGVLRRCMELPGAQVFRYRDAQGVVRRLTSTDVNDYLRDASGTQATAKDFRTWGATREATALCLAHPPCRNATEAKRCTKAIVDAVAGRLGNTPAVCRSAYIHPAVLTHFANAWCDGREPPGLPRVRGLDRTERVTLALIEARAD
ncbi:DNA topoisomerase IB [Chitiniphilus purpureus]|uniref:DNA topoisomerase n=1 Tax=Chitiniphilus purpureus TaxID=2981137 RepID=A0ABY6DM16_9NEIS|nr:DNA topoisomerase IB [Chitiniphilus sp. CD1]UXY15391.1 DNA topoisomerase IB [Chitiniphilus sp. CD1]